MPTTGLFNGVAVIIDDEIERKDAKINEIIDQIEGKRIPCVKYNELPEPETINHLQEISFLLLDWMILDKEIQDSILDGVKVPNTLEKENIEANIDFLKSLFDKCFVPVFIFTNEDPDNIISILEDNGLYSDDKPNFIFVKRKSELDNERLFAEINAWIQKNPSIYALKAWENEYTKAKNLLFLDFYNMSHSWPTILWNNFKDDSVNMSKELGEIITKNLHTRMKPFSFHEDFLKEEMVDVDKDEIRKVIEGERFIREVRLHKGSIMAGDVFGTSGGGLGKVYLNIRPDCDCIPDRNDPDATLDDVKMYLLKGKKLRPRDENDLFNDKYGNFKERDNESLVFSMVDGNSYCFKFKDIIVADWKDFEDRRVGRLLPPHITRIQQRYAFYLQRQGIPRTPVTAVTGQIASVDGSESIEVSDLICEDKKTNC